MVQDRSQRLSVAAIEAGIRQVLARDMRPSQLLECDKFPYLRAVAAETNGSGDRHDWALALETVLRRALDVLGNGEYGRAAERLLGAIPGTRGRPTKDRRQLAAGELGITVESFRKYREDDMLLDIAMEVYRLELEARSPRTPWPA